MTGIEIHIDPIIVSFGSVAISWHGVGMVIAIIVAVWLSARLVARDGLSVDRLYAIALWGVPGGIIGARLVHVIDYWDYYTANPGAVFSLWLGGLALWGGILGGILMVLVYARVKKISIARYADWIAPGMILAQAIGRVGDIINGEHFSKSAGPPWGVVYIHPNSPAFGMAPAHLAVGYELVFDLFLFGLLWKLMGRLKPDGTLFLLYLGLYSIGRFFLSFLRLDSQTVELGLSQPQWLSLIVLVSVIALYFRRLRAMTVPEVAD